MEVIVRSNNPCGEGQILWAPTRAQSRAVLRKTTHLLMAVFPSCSPYILSCR